MEWKKEENRMVPVGLPPFRRFLVVTVSPGDGAVVIGEVDTKGEAEALGRSREGIEFFRIYEGRSEHITVRPEPYS